jgi:hypothetical protein
VADVLSGWPFAGFGETVRIRVSDLLEDSMGRNVVVLGLLLTASMAFAKDLKAYQSGELLQMDSVSCSLPQKSGNSQTGDMTETGPEHVKTQGLCQEYVLQTDRTIYRIRPVDKRHPGLLPVGERAQFRFDKDKVLLRVEYADSKEREYFVVSVARRGDSSAEASPVRLNHLQ